MEVIMEKYICNLCNGQKQIPPCPKCKGKPELDWIEYVIGTGDIVDFDYGYKGCMELAGATVTFATTAPDGVDNNSQFYFQNAASHNLAIIWHSTQASPEQTPNNDGRLSSGKVFNAVYNDIADFMELDEPIEVIECGKVYVRDKDNKVRISESYCEKGILGIASDTYGYGLGVKNFDFTNYFMQIPICIGGFVLAYVDKQYEPGTPLTSAPNGYLTEMKEEERCKNPERLVGTYLKVEKKDEWNDVVVNGRHWIKV